MNGYQETLAMLITNRKTHFFKSFSYIVYNGSSVLNKKTISRQLFYFLQVLANDVGTTNIKAKSKMGIRRILMVDDEVDITVTLKMALEDSGFFEVNTFNDPV